MDENTNMNAANKRLPEALGERIAFLRKLKGLTQTQLAEKLGISAQAVSKWESGLSCPDILMLMPLAELFEISTDLLLGGGQLTGQENLPKQAAEDPTVEVPLMQEKTKEQPPSFVEESIAEDSKAEESLVLESKVEETKTEESKTEESKEEACNEPKDKGAEKESETTESRKALPGNQVAIHSLYIDISLADAIIREGNEFALDVSGYTNGDCREEVKDGVWRIKDKGYKDLFVLSSFINFFTERKITIIIPRGYHFKDVRIKLGAGKLIGRNILTDTSSLDLGAGEIVFADYCSGPSKIKCGMGKVMLQGKLTGTCKLDCGMGEIGASLRVPADYGYRVKVGMGDVRVGEDRFGGIGGTYKCNAHAENFFDINCGMGSVKVLLDA